VPVIFPCGNDGKSGMTFPIKAGDGGLIIFAESQLTDFLTGSGDSEDTRRHSLNDAIFLPGLYSNAIPKSISNPNDLCVFSDGGYFKLNGNEFSGEVAGTQFKFGGGQRDVASCWCSIKPCNILNAVTFFKYCNIKSRKSGQASRLRRSN